MIVACALSAAVAAGISFVYLVRGSSIAAGSMCLFGVFCFLGYRSFLKALIRRKDMVARLHTEKEDR